MSTSDSSASPPGALIVPDLVRLDVPVGPDKKDVIEYLADVVASAGRADTPEGLAADALAREATAPTGIPGGIAIPHCRSPHVLAPSLGFARLAGGVDFGAADGESANLVFMIAAPAGADDFHLKLLAKLARGLMKPEFTGALRSAATPQDVARIITEQVQPELLEEGAQAAGAGYDITKTAQNIVLGDRDNGILATSLWNLPDLTSKTYAAEHALAGSPLAAYIGAVLYLLGSAGMSLLVPALAGYTAFGLAGRPGIAPGFIMGLAAVATGSGFIGGLLGGILAGYFAAWLAGLNAPRWLRSLMPVVIIPLFTTLVVGSVMYMLLGRPLASFMTWLTESLTAMANNGAGVLLGVIVGLMMCFDLGGPVNKAAYLFGTAGLDAGTPASYEIMAAVMAAGMVPPLALALATTIRPNLFTGAERDNGRAAWLLGASFISEGAIPFAAADPLRIIPPAMAGGAVTGAMSMALHAASRAPHGGVFVFFAMDNFAWFVISILVGAVISCAGIVVLKQMAANKKAVEEGAAKAAPAAA